jgi:hypothetical protein
MTEVKKVRPAIALMPSLIYSYLELLVDLSARINQIGNTVLIYIISLFLMKKENTIIVVFISSLALIFLDIVFVTFGLARYFQTPPDLPNIPPHVEYVTTSGYSTSVMAREFRKTYYGPGQVAFYNLPEMPLEYRKQDIETDINGLRNSNFDQNKHYKGITLGDSFCFGYSVDQDNVLASRISLLLNEPFYNTCVYGAGVPDQTLLVEDLLKRGMVKLKESPIFVLTVFEGNDFNDSSAFSRNLEKPPFPSRILEHMRDRSLLPIVKTWLKHAITREDNASLYQVFESAQLGRFVLNSSYIKNVESNNENIESAMRLFNQADIPKSLNQLNEIARQYKAMVIVIYIPEKSRILTAQMENLTLPKDIMKVLLCRESNQNKFLFVDMTKYFRQVVTHGSLVFWRDDTHLNVKGIELITKQVARNANLDSSTSRVACH